MKAGLHTGTFTFVTTTASHRELLLAGAAASTTVATEALAEPGRLLVSADLAAALPAGWTMAPDRPAMRVRLGAVAELTPAETRPPPPTLPDERLLRLVPPALGALLGRGPIGEHRPLAVAFIAVPDTDRLTRDECLVARLDDVVGAIDRACARFDLCWLKSDVGVDQVRFVLTAGLSRRSEDDEGRLLSAVREIADRNPGLQIGVNSGTVFVADVGHQRRARRTTCGATCPTSPPV